MKDRKEGRVGQTRKTPGEMGNALFFVRVVRTGAEKGIS